MYKIIGGDQKEYGPVSAEEISRWIAEGRLNAQSMIRAEGTKEWKPLASFSEFVTALNAQAAARGVPAFAAPPVTPHDFAAQALTGAGHIRIGACFSRSWNLLKGNFGLFYGAAFIVMLISMVLGRVPLHLGSIVFFLLKGAFYGGLYLVFLKRIRGEPASIVDVFAGFHTNFLHLVLAGVVTSVLEFIGVCCCLIPALYLMIAWLFAIPLVIDRGLEFWSGMELSRKVVTRIWFEAFGLFLVAFLPLIVAFIFIQVKGTITTMPMVQDLMRSGQPPDLKQVMDAINQSQLQHAGEQAIMGLIVQVVWLLNWPFALGALLYAYEDLSGARKSASP